MLQMAQSLKQDTWPPLMGTHLPLVQDALQIPQGDAIRSGQDGQHKISQVLLCLAMRTLFWSFLQCQWSRNGWRKDDLKATGICSLLHTTPFSNLHSFPIACCCPFDGSQQDCTQLAWTIIGENQSPWVVTKSLIAKQRWRQTIRGAAHLLMSLTHRQ